jgi:amidase/6-aminohexanoate-cyclic-dimer hydrolase
MAGFKEYDNYDALGLADLVKKKEVSPQELLDEAIDRTERINPEINAVTIKTYDLAKEQIKAGLPAGPFEGVPYLLKDLHLGLKGSVTTSGCKLFADYIPEYDSTLTARYKQAGMVLFGKTNTPEFGLTTTTEPALFGPSRNPWEPGHTTGGSSGGAAAAVAARILPIANASDGGGSIRIPASCCGIFGMKPTRARTPMGPDRSEGWNGLSISHAVSLSVRDNAALLDATTGPESGDLYIAPKPERSFLEETTRDPGTLRIAYSAVAAGGTTVDPECIAAVEKGVELCRALGHEVEEAAPVYNAEDLGGALLTFIAAHTANAVQMRAAQLGRELVPDDVEKQTWRMVEMARAMNGSAYANAQTTLQLEIKKVARFFETYDVFIQPVLGQPPVALGVIDMNSDDLDAYITRLTTFTPFTSLYNMTGQPSMSVPLHWTANDLPVGTMFTGRYGQEGVLFRLAAQMEKASPWIDKSPKVRA